LELVVLVLELIMLREQVATILYFQPLLPLVAAVAEQMLPVFLLLVVRVAVVLAFHPVMVQLGILLAHHHQVVMAHPQLLIKDLPEVMGLLVREVAAVLLP
jgi:hypothetical protein